MKLKLFSTTTICVFSFCLFPFKVIKAQSNQRTFINAQNIDKSVKPGNDFYRYANGTWLKTAKIPDEYPSIGAWFEVRLTIQKRLKGLLEDAAKSNSKVGSIQQKVGDFYISGMDTIAINKRNYDPVKPLLAKIDAANSAAALMQIAAEEEKNGNETVFGLYVYPDQKHSSANITWLVQKGIGLPERIIISAQMPQQLACKMLIKIILLLCSN